MEICINIRRRSVTICEILQKQKTQVRYISRIWEKKIVKLWKIEKLREKNVEIMEEKALPIRIILSWKVEVM